MADNLSMALAELLRKADAEPDLDTLREGVRVMTQALMELEVAQHLGADLDGLEAPGSIAEDLVGGPVGWCSPTAGVARIRSRTPPPSRR